MADKTYETKDADPPYDFWENSRASIDIIINQARVLKIIEFDKLLDGYNRAEAVGAVLDPTGYHNHGRSIRKAKQIVEATKRWITEVEKILEM